MLSGDFRTQEYRTLWTA